MELHFEHLKDCRVLPNRYHILNHLPKDSIGIEMGVLAGDFSQNILKMVLPKKLYLIDLFDSNDFASSDRFSSSNHFQFVQSRFESEINDGKLEMRKGYSINKLGEFPDRFFDWIYVDTDHSYDLVKSELEVSRSKIKDGGWIIMNDYIFHDHLLNVPYGVVQATNEFCIEHGWKWEFFALHDEMFCDVAMRKI